MKTIKDLLVTTVGCFIIYACGYLRCCIDNHYEFHWQSPNGHVTFDMNRPKTEETTVD